MNATAPKLKSVEDVKPAEASSKKTFVFVTVGMLLGLIVGFLSYNWYIYADTHITTDNAYVETDYFPVNSRTMGFIKTVTAVENAFVKKGETLAIFDNKDLLLELSYKQAKLDKATNDFKRAQRLIKTATISKMDYEAAQAAYNANKTDLEATQLKMEFTHIRAPSDGFIAKKTVQVGQFIQPGQSLFIVVPLANAWVKANFKETQIRKIKPGMRVELQADALPSHKFHGWVESIAPSSGSRLSLLPPENATGNFTKVVQRFPVIIRLEESARKALRAGMSMTTTVLAYEDGNDQQ